MSCSEGDDGKCVTCHGEMGSGTCAGDDGFTDLERSSKMYILVKETIHPGFAAVAIAHASLGGYLHFVANEVLQWRRRQAEKGNVIVPDFQWHQERDARMRSAMAELGHDTAARCVSNSMSCWVKEGDAHPTETETWAEASFRKVVCSVTDDQFQEAKTYGVVGDDFRVMTESSLGGEEVAIVFKPRGDWEPFFKRLPLWGRSMALVAAASLPGNCRA